MKTIEVIFDNVSMGYVSRIDKATSQIMLTNDRKRGMDATAKDAEFCRNASKLYKFSLVVK